MKRLLVLTAKTDELNLIFEAKRQGYYLITTGNAPSQPGHRYADEYVPFDYSDYEGVTELARKLHVDAVLQGCSDNCALTAAYICEKLGLPGHDTFENAEIIHRKDKFKKFVREHHIQSPVAELYHSAGEACAAANALKYPVIVKPTGRAGGQGVSVATTAGEYKASVGKAFSMAREGEYIVVEPYLVGTLHSLDTFIVDGRVVAFGTANDYSYHNKYMTNTGLFPADDSDAAVRELIPETERIAQLLNLVDGQLHMQYMMAGGRPWIIEMMRRSPGNRFTIALGNSIGIDWDAWVVRAESGENCKAIPHSHRPDRYYGYQSFIPPRNGVYKGYSIDPNFRGQVFQVDDWKRPGHLITDFENDKMGNLQFFFDGEEKKNWFVSQMNDLVKVDVE